MVIDALRQDFVYDERRFPEAFPFLRSILGRGTNAKGVVAVAKAPTVTLPRLRALTAGTSPVFLDLLHNLSSQDESSPHGSNRSWIEAMKNDNKTLLLYGDDTWLRMFPAGTFSKESQGTHSFLVTDTVEVDRNVTRHLPLLFEKPWDGVVLHYLGVDHVGHVGGVASSLMIPKLQEMDAVIQDLYSKITQSDLEAKKRTLFVVLGDHGMTESGNHGGSSSQETDTAAIFLTPSISSYSNGEGLRVEQVDLVPTISLLLGLPVPAGSTGALAPSLVPLLSSEANLQCMLRANFKQLSSLSSPSSEEAIGPLLEQINGISQKLISSTAGDYNIPLMLIAILILIPTLNGTIDLRILVVYSIYALSQFASTFIEEEHFIWYHLLMTVAFFDFIQHRSWKSALSLVLIRLLTGWNSTGSQFRSEPDIGGFLKSHPSLCLLMVSLGLLLSSKNKRCIPGIIFVSLYKASQLFDFQIDQILLARLALLAIIPAGVSPLFFQLLLQPHNCLPLALLAHLMGSSPIQWILAMKSSFFMLGGAHIIANIDFSPAYLAQRTFYLPLVCFSTILLIWAGPLLVLFSQRKRLSVEERDALVVSHSMVLISVMSSLFLQRHHISIWTVFAPRLLFEYGWHLFYLLFIIVVTK